MRGLALCPCRFPLYLGARGTNTRGRCRWKHQLSLAPANSFHHNHLKGFLMADTPVHPACEHHHLAAARHVTAAYHHMQAIDQHKQCDHAAAGSHADSATAESAEAHKHSASACAMSKK
jgi:hypothetical protein